MTVHERLGQLLARMEIPDCKCGLRWEKLYLSAKPPESRKGVKGHTVRAPDPVCRHMLARDHKCSLADWLLKLLLYDVTEYTPHPMVRQLVRCLTQEERIVVMIQREDDGENLFHPLERRTRARLGRRINAAGEEVPAVSHQSQQKRPPTPAERRAKLLSWEDV